MPIDGSTVLVALHCHSDRSDGDLSPARLAERLAAEGVRFAALTDHDTVGGLAEFRAALLLLGIGAIDGVEITAASPFGELHLLGYGMDPAHAGLLALLESARRQTDDGMQGLVDSLKRIRSGSMRPPAGIPPAQEAIRAVHAAGGAAFLAHPLSYGLDGDSLETCLRGLKAAGLDGLEAVYSPYAAEEIRRLLDLAAVHGLAVSAGSDYHGPGMHGHSSAGVPMSRVQWTALRELLFRPSSGGRAAQADRAQGPHPRDIRRMAPGGFAARIAAPALIAMALFTLSIFAVILPRFERILLDRKKDMIRELTNSAVSILREYAAEESAQRMGRAQAQAAAAARVRDLRYGAEGKDYFWITDMRPAMIMHPYRTELDGSDLTGYMDANGVLVFVEFVNAVRQKEEGYVEYLWQWKDDSHRIVPKLSFVKRFPAWDWVVGTGIYLDDVNAEILRVTGSLIRISAGIAVAIAVLLFLVVQQSLSIERRRRRAESALGESHERYRALVEAASEGMVVVIDGACAYANPTFLSMLGYTEGELPLLGISEILRPYAGAEDEVRAFIASLDKPSGSGPTGALECILAGKNGREIDAVLTASRLGVGARMGTVLIARDVSAGYAAPGGGGSFPALWEEGGIGLFRASWGRKSFILECNAEARRIFGPSQTTDAAAADLFALAADARDADRLRAELSALGAVRDRDLALCRADGSSCIVSLTLVRARNPARGSRIVEGMARDVTVIRRRERARSELLVELEENRVRAASAEVPFSIVMDRMIRAARSVQELSESRRKLLELLRELMEGGAPQRNIGLLYVSASDLMVERLVDLALADLGKPPAAFAFLALGSEGRREQIPGSDQDNAVIFEPAAESARESARGYFLALGEKVCGGLDAIGVPLCAGGVMARNRPWCATIQEWQGHFTAWIRTPEPRELLEFNTFFDLRCLAGETELTERLLACVRGLLAENPPFFPHHARDELDRRLPVFRKGGTLDAKQALAPIVSFARIYALRHGVRATHTLQRLEILRDAGVLDRGSFQDTVLAFECIARLRMACQLSGRGNAVEISSLSQADETLLKEAIASLGVLRKKIGWDFLGTVL